MDGQRNGRSPSLLVRGDDRRSEPLMNSLIGVLAPLPQHVRQSLTFDLWPEFVVS